MTTISGSSGSDTLSGTNKADSISGGGGNDTISAGGGNDTIHAGDGNDKVYAGDGNDKVYAGNGNDTVYAGDGNDKVWGEAGDDVIYGENGNDLVDGGDGNDKIFGGDGNDTLIGGAGADQLTGGSGKDVFVYLAASDSSTRSWDGITDFTQGKDKIDLSALLGRADLAWGSKSALVYGAWYENSGSSTFVYADTTGNGMADLKIELKNTSGLTLTSSDFIGVSNSPVAVADTASGTENQTLTIDVLANDRGSDSHGWNDSHDRDDRDDRDDHDDRGNCDHRDDRDDHAFNERDGHAFTLVSAAAPAGKGTVSVVNNQVQFNPGTDFDHLAKDVVEHVTLTYTMRDETGAQSSSTVDVTVTGTNDAPVVTGAVTGGATEDGATVTLNALAKASDVDDGATLSVVNVPGSLPTSVTYNAATHSFTLDPSNAAYQHLAAGEHAMVTVNYGVSDGIATTAASVSWDITGTNDNPEITSGAQSGNVSEGDDGANMSASGHVTFMDVDTSDAHTFSVSIGPDYGSGSVNAQGKWTYTVDDSGAVDALAAGEQLSDSFTVKVDDGHGGFANQLVSIDITGTNDDPFFTSGAQSGIVSEGDDGSSMTATGLVTFSDVDLSDTHALSVSGTPKYGMASVDDTGNWSYTVVDAGDVDALAAGKHLSDSFQVQVDDHHGGFATEVVHIDIIGTNDAPVITSDGGGDSAHVFVAENTTNVTNVDADDPDTGALQTYQILHTAGTDWAAFHINSSSGLLKFNVAPDLEHPTDVGGTPGDNTYVVNVQVTDDVGATDTQSIAVTVTGSHSVIANDDIVLTNIPQGSDILIPASALLANDTGALNLPLHVATVADAEDSDVVSLSSGDVTYVDNAPLNGSFDYTASDGQVESAFAHVTVQTQEGPVQGTPESEILIAGDGDDFLEGFEGNDFLFGGAGNDSLLGDAGNDTLVGGAGDDFLSGDGGNDTFDYNALSDAGMAGDLIFDFQHGMDRLDLHDLLTSFGASHDSTAFDNGYVQFTNDTGVTLVEVDSNGGGDSFVTLATVITDAPLTSADFIL